MERRHSPPILIMGKVSPSCNLSNSSHTFWSSLNLSQLGLDSCGNQCCYHVHGDATGKLHNKVAHFFMKKSKYNNPQLHSQDLFNLTTRINLKFVFGENRSKDYSNYIFEHKWRCTVIQRRPKVLKNLQILSSFFFNYLVLILVYQFSKLA